VRWKTRNSDGTFALCEAIEIDQPPRSVFSAWSRVEDFPRFMSSVRRTKRIDEERVMWDVDIEGRQIVWESFLLKSIPARRMRWTSAWGAPNSGEARFDALADGRTRLTVSIQFRPRNQLESLGARLGLVDRHVRRDLECVRRYMDGEARTGSRRSKVKEIR